MAWSPVSSVRLPRQPLLRHLLFAVPAGAVLWYITTRLRTSATSVQSNAIFS